MGSHNCTVTCDGNGIVGIPMEMPHGDRKSTRLNQSPCNLVCRLLLEKKKKKNHLHNIRTEKYDRHSNYLTSTRINRNLYYDLTTDAVLGAISRDVALRLDVGYIYRL